MNLNPIFDDLNNVNTLTNHITQLVKRNAFTPHAEILLQLINQLEIIDFLALAFPEVIKLRQQIEKLDPKSEKAIGIEKHLASLKLSLKHFLVLSIENVLLISKKNRWGLCKNHDFIYLYNGTFWADIDKETFQKFLGEAAEKMGVAKFSARHYEFKEKLFKQFLSSAYLPTPENNNEKVLINLQNGTFEISPQGTKLRTFNSTDFITYQLPFEYDPKAKASLFEAYLNRVLPDKERQSILAEYLGFVFIKHGSNTLKEEKALILYGTGANGKSVFFEIVNALLGSENVSSYSLQSLTNDNGYYRAKLANTLVNYASEINGKLETSTFKQMVSGEPVEARLPYGQPFMLKQYAKLIFNVNELPKDVEHTNAYFRRFLIIPFDVTIPESEQDKQLHTKIIEKELSGVFNWVLEGLNRLLEQKHFSACEAADKALESYKTESNSIKLFLVENEFQNHPTVYQLIKDLYFEYRSFCSDDGMQAFKKTNFIKQLKALGVQVERINIGNVAYLKRSNESF